MPLVRRFRSLTNGPRSELATIGPIVNRRGYAVLSDNQAVDKAAQDKGHKGCCTVRAASEVHRDEACALLGRFYSANPIPVSSYTARPRTLKHLPMKERWTVEMIDALKPVGSAPPTAVAGNNAQSTSGLAALDGAGDGEGAHGASEDPPTSESAQSLDMDATLV